MPLHLVGTVLDRRVSHEIQGSVTIGRSGGCEIQVPEPSVSREHARIEVENERATIVDLGSRNGTWVNGARVDEKTEIRAGDKIEVGGILFEVDPGGVSDRTILAADATMTSSSAVNWREIYGPSPTSADTGAGHAARKLDLFQVLAEAGELLTANASLDVLSEAILDLVEKAVSAERIMVLMLDDASHEPVVRASRVHKGETGAIMLSKTMLEKVMNERTSFLTLDAMHDPRFEAQESIIIQGTRSAMAAPLFDNENVIGVLYADTTDPSTRYSRDELRTFTILANLIGVKITQARLAEAEEEKKRLELQLRTAKDILTNILPDRLAEVDGYEIRAFQEPCLTVGGDLYDARRLSDGRVLIVIGDVTGKGLGAALLVSNVMASMRLLTDQRLSPLELVGRLNRHVHRSTDPMHFVTLFYGVLEPESGRIEYVNAGHNPPLVVEPGGDMREIGATGMPVGTLDDVEYGAGTTTLAPGATMLLYSDGIPEAETPDGAEFGMERLEKIFLDESPSGAEAIVTRVREAVTDFLGAHPATDDVTMLCVRRIPG